MVEQMGLRTIYPKENLSKRAAGTMIMPYLLRDLTVDHSNQVWSIDITYIKMGRGHMYLTAILDWYSRKLLAWELSDTLETDGVLEAVRKAIEEYGKPEIINSDQGAQFTSDAYKALLKQEGIKQSMDGKGRWADNVRIERWFRSLKVEALYINDYETPRALRKGIDEYVTIYNTIRPHESLDYETPEQYYKDHMMGVYAESSVA